MGFEACRRAYRRALWFGAVGFGAKPRPFQMPLDSVYQPMGEIERARCFISPIVDNHYEVKVVGHYYEIRNRNGLVDLVKRQKRRLYDFTHFSKRWPCLFTD